MIGILVSSPSGYNLISFNYPEELFGSSREFTVMGASARYSYIILGNPLVQEELSQRVSHLPESVLDLFEYDYPPKGKLLILKTDEMGEIVDLSRDDVNYFRSF